MTLEKALSGVIPWQERKYRASRQMKYPLKYEFISKHYDEIEAAREGGYSYHQIIEGLHKAYGLEISYALLVHYYYKVKKVRKAKEAANNG